MLKPKNINSKPKESQISSQLDRHPPSLGNDPVSYYYLTLV